VDSANSHRSRLESCGFVWLRHTGALVPAQARASGNWVNERCGIACRRRSPRTSAAVTRLLKAGPAALFRVDCARTACGQPGGLAEEWFSIFQGGVGLFQRLVKTIPRLPGEKRAGGLNL
jgi:hypothetical protein